MPVNVFESSLDTTGSLNAATSLQVFTDTDMGYNLFNTHTCSSSSSFNSYLDYLNTNTDGYLIQDAENSFLWTTAYDADGITPQAAASIFNPTSNSGSKSSSDSAIAPQTSSSTNIIKGTLTADGTYILKGTLTANTFIYQPKIDNSTVSRTVIYGNGNVDFGSGARDTLDLSQINSNTVGINYANSSTGGVVYNSGNGNSVFDAITFGDGSQILFEGIEAIKFADTTISSNLSVTPNDPLFNQQWNLHMMGVQDAWRFTQGTNKVLIGIDDTGLGTNSSGNIHPDLRSTTFIADNYLDESPTDSHGTKVEGVIAATSNNGIGISGINWNSDVFLIDVVGDEPSVYNLANATQKMIDRANTNGQRLIVNLSFSGGNSPAFEQLVAFNQDKALFVIASGNDDKNSLASPANLAINHNNVIAVGACWGTRDWYSNPKTPGDRISYSWWGSNFGNGLTLMAPSEYITTNATRINSNTTYNFGYETLFNGTSAAAPNVTGVASLVWSVNPSLTATQVKSILSETAVDLGSPGYDPVYGNGFVNADAAVRRALAMARGYA